MPLVLVAAVISTLHLEGDVTAAGGDYAIVPFDVPAGTVEIEILHVDGSESTILDWGVWSPAGFRGWGGGLTDPAVIGVDESSRGYLPGPIDAATWELVIGKAKLSGGAAHWVVDITFRDAATLTPEPRAAWEPVVVAAGERWWAGDLHVHSEESGDASATLDAIAALARDRGLDFVVVTDHNTVSHHERLAAFQGSLDDLLLVRGIEVTTYAGHGNAIGASAYVDHRVGHGGVTSDTIARAIDAQGAVFSVNHPALDLGDSCIGCAWDHADTPWDLVGALELQTGPFDVTGVLFTPQAIARWDELLDGGARLAAVGGSDDHRASPDATGTQSPIGSPTTLVWTDELSEPAIVEAVRAGRTVVKLRSPDDPMAWLTAEDAAGGIARIGDTVTGVGRARLTVHVTGGAGTDVEIWRDGALVEVLPVDGDDWSRALDYPVSGDPERYRAEVVDGGGRLTVTSHLWIDGDPSLDEGGCGCRTAPGPGGFALAALVLGFLAQCPRRRRR